MQETLSDAEAGCSGETVVPGPAQPISTLEAGDLEGKILDERYELLKRLGAGGMGVVYAARHVVLGSRLAVKVLRPPPAAQAEAATERFRREARAASALGHPNIVDVRDFGTLEGGLSYYVMEHLEGIDLLAEIQRVGQLPVSRLAHIGKQIAEALGAAHAQDIVHRDMKPENVFLTTRNGVADHVKLIDFGIAKVNAGDLAFAHTLPPVGAMVLGASPSGGRVTAAGVVLGTPAYMSPEQCAGGEVDYRSDIYALGVLLYEAATGTIPFEPDNVFELMRMHQQSPAPDPRALAPDLPNELAELILDCLEKSPPLRPASMKAVVDRLGAFVVAPEPRSEAAEEAAIRASVVARREPVPSPVRRDGPGFSSGASPPRTAMEPARASSQRAWSGVAVIGVLLVVAFVAVGTYVWRSSERAPAAMARVAEPPASAPVLAAPPPSARAAPSAPAALAPRPPMTTSVGAPPTRTPAHPPRVRARPPRTHAETTSAEVTPPPVSSPPAPAHARPTDAVRDPWAND